MLAVPGVVRVMQACMLDVSASPLHALSSGLCEDVSGEALSLIRRMAKGEPAALAELHSNWGPVLLGIACRMLGDRREADEVLHRAFLAIWKRADTYDPHQSPPFVWALVMMRGIAIDRLRRGRAARDARDVRNPVPGTRGENPKPLSSDDCTRLNSAMDQLDPEDLACLESAVFLEYTRNDRSDAFAVKNRLRRTLDQLRNSLSRHEL